MKPYFLLISLFIFTACLPDDQKSSDSKKQSSHARIKTTHGEIVFEFYETDAPQTTARIKELIKQSFYNGLTFHRVIPGFVIQGGDPTGTGSGGSGKNIKAEFNHHKHVPGTVAMARSSDINSADSQFYISLGTHPHLDNQYTIFGKVTQGLDVANKIQVGDKIITIILD